MSIQEMTIKDIRKAHGLSQTKLSEITGIPARTIQNWEAESETAKRKCPEWLPGMMEVFLNAKEGI